jgi:predicted transcriptional regulator
LNKHNPDRRRLFGPGTIAMIVGLLGFGLYSFLSRPGEIERVYYEADAAGKLRQVERPSHIRSSPPPLWKPEPAALLEHQRELRLASDQIRRIESIESAWVAKKEDLEARIKREVEFLGTESRKPASVAAVNSQLGDYSALSREYARLRKEAWDSALALLSRAQRSALAPTSQEVVR